MTRDEKLNKLLELISFDDKDNIYFDAEIGVHNLYLPTPGMTMDELKEWVKNK